MTTAFRRKPKTRFMMINGAKSILKSQHRPKYLRLADFDTLSPVVTGNQNFSLLNNSAVAGAFG